MEPEPSIRVENLTRRFGPVTAIRDVSFIVNPGEVVGFLGPNGAGKSTTMRILCGILAATSGSAWIAGVPVALDPREAKRRIGYMPENNPLPEDMRVVEYLRFRARLKEVPYRRVRAVVQEVMEVCDLARTARRKIIGTLSKGFRQRVGIADTLIGSPQVIVMDEPTIGLDPHQVRGIRGLIDDLRGRHTVVISSHILPEIERSCDRVIIINRGRIVASGTGANLRDEFLPGARFELEVAGTREAVEDLLHQNGVGGEIEESRAMTEGACAFTLRTEDADLLSEDLIRIFSTSGTCTLRALAPRQPSLEEIFLAATRRSWEETHDPAALKPAGGTAEPPEAKENTTPAGG